MILSVIGLALSLLGKGYYERDSCGGGDKAGGGRKARYRRVQTPLGDAVGAVACIAGGATSCIPSDARGQQL